MAKSYDYSKRADDIADTTRRFLVGLNTGGIAVTLTFAGSLMERQITPGWVVEPVSFFVLGLVISGTSLLYAKHKALKRRNAVRDRKKVPKFDAWYQRNFTYEIIALVIFFSASAVGIYRVQGITFELPKAVQNVEKKVEEKTSNSRPAANLGPVSLSPSPQSLNNR